MGFDGSNTGVFMRQLSLAVLAAAAFSQFAVAADLPAKAPVYAQAPPMVAVYNWTGFYVGVNAGTGWADTSFEFAGDNGAGAAFVDDFSNRSPALTKTGFVGGGQLGYNWQVAPNWLIGFETDIQYANVRGSTSVQIMAVAAASRLRIDAEQSLDWFGTLRARLGVTPTERLLFFATGGFAYGKTRASASVTNLEPPGGFGGIFAFGADGTNLFCPLDMTCFTGAGSRTAPGWVGGAGFEYALGDRVSLKAEYLHVDLGTHTVHLSVTDPVLMGDGAISARFKAAFEILRGGVNIRF
jgi:outer membrane immunogenic protein